MNLLFLTPHTIYFSDRPQRIVGHLTHSPLPSDDHSGGHNSFTEPDPAPDAVPGLAGASTETARS